MDWLDNLWRLPLTLLILIRHGEMEEKINWSKEQLLWLSHFHEWNQSAMWFNRIVSNLFLLWNMLNISLTPRSPAYVKYSLHRLILDPQILLLPNQNVSCCLCADSNINKDPLRCRLASVGMTPKTQPYSVWKQGLFLSYQSSHGNAEFSTAYSVSGLRFVPCIVLHSAGVKFLATPN